MTSALDEEVNKREMKPFSTSFPIAKASLDELPERESLLKARINENRGAFEVAVEASVMVCRRFFLNIIESERVCVCAACRN